jgi:hydrogenase maturation protease
LKRKVVLGIGNTLNRDEGLGVHALNALESHLHASGLSLLPEVELLDGGTLGLNLLPIVEESSHLLILDAVDANQPPGAVVELRKEEIPLFSGIKMSQHQATFQEVLGLASIRGLLPEHLHLVGIQPYDLAIGMELSELVAASFPEFTQRIMNVLRDWELLAKP